jgi:hypothetical protein
MLHQSQAQCMEVSNLKYENQGACCDAVHTEDVKGIKGRHAKCMGLTQTPRSPIRSYCPTPGLISLFRKTGTSRRNPNAPQNPCQAAAPSSGEPLPKRRTYADTLRNGMEGGGMYGNGVGNGVQGNGSGSF